MVHGSYKREHIPALVAAMAVPESIRESDRPSRVSPAERAEDLTHSYPPCEVRCGRLCRSAPSRLVMAGVDLPAVASLMGPLNIQMTMRYAHLALAHKAAAVKKLSAFNALERKRQRAVILFPAGHEKPTDTTTDTKAKDGLAVAMGSFS